MIFDLNLAYWQSVECCQQISSMEYVDNIKHQTLFITADGHAKMQHVSESSMTGVMLSTNWYGGSMLITASVSFVYISRQWRQSQQNNLFVIIGKPEAKVTNNRRLHSRCYTVEANYWQT